VTASSSRCNYRADRAEHNGDVDATVESEIVFEVCRRGLVPYRDAGRLLTSLRRAPATPTSPQTDPRARPSRPPDPEPRSLAWRGRERGGRPPSSLHQPDVPAIDQTRNAG
jgi:hypothetical protein